jgi:hypothetical protein
MAFNYDAVLPKKDEGRPGLVELASNYKAGKLQTIDPFDPAPMVQDLKEAFQAKLIAMHQEVDALEVIDDASSANAAAMASQAQQMSNALAKAQKIKTDPYHKVKSYIDGFCKSIKDEFQEIKRLAENKNRSYLMEQERKRQEADRKAREEAAKLQAEQERKRQEAEAQGKDPEPQIVPIVQDVPKKTEVVTESGSQKIEYDLVAELVDVRLLPDACIKARWEQIKSAVAPWVNAQIKAGVENIPGFVISKQAKVKTRASRLSQGEW